MSGRVAAMILTRDRPAGTRRTVQAVLEQDRPPEVLLLIDNAATPEVRCVLDAAAKTHPEIDVLRLPENRGCAGGYEAGIARLMERGDVDYVCGFDDDATPAPGCLSALIEATDVLPDAGAV